MLAWVPSMRTYRLGQPAQIRDIPLEIIKALIQFSETSEKFFMVETADKAAAIASEFVVGLYPSDRFLRFMAAPKTSNPGFGILEHDALQSRGGYHINAGR
jgi:hypothetical protein